MLHYVCSFVQIAGAYLKSVVADETLNVRHEIPLADNVAGTGR